MNITNVECLPFQIPLKKPLKFAAGSLTTLDDVLVRVTTDEGLVGYGEAPSRPGIYGETQASIVAAIEMWWAAGVIPTDPFQTELLWTRLNRTMNNHCAKAALDLAFHDLIGKSLDVSCSRLLGAGSDRARVTHQIAFDTPEGMVASAQEMQAEYGITSFKVKIGTEVSRDIRALQLLRDAFPDALIYADANQGYSHGDALRVLGAAADANVAWLEELVPADAVHARQQLAAQTRVPIGGDESCRTTAEIAQELRLNAIHRVTIKVARGGHLMSSRMTSLCRSLGVPTVIGTQGECGLGTFASLQFAAGTWLAGDPPAELAVFTELAGDILTESPRIEDGEILVPKRPGLGAEIDEEKLRHYAQ